MFGTLNEKLEKIVKSIAGRATISEDDLDITLREIRIALLEADVALSVVKDFIDNVKSNIVGKEVLKSIKPDQMIIKLVQEELIKILGLNNEPLNIAKTGITKILFCGLQGSGKTTTIAKVANFIKKNSKKKILLVSSDIYRPAAQEQLQVLGKQINVEFFDHQNSQSVEAITLESIKYAEKNLFDILLFDTAGRQVVDDKMMEELKTISQKLKPQETILVADSLTGQDAANIAKRFNETVSITSSILTRVDGDGRGGAALSIKSITGAPIKFIGTGEKIDQLESFHPERIANRILGMGDIVSLVEKASENIDKKEMEDLAKKMSKGKFDLEDFAGQLKQMGKMGGISGIMSMLPGISKAQKLMAENKISDDVINHQIAIINSMTKKERADPDMVKASRKIRISKGSGTRVQDVNKLLKQFFQSQKMMKKMKSTGKGGMPSDLLQKLQGNLPPNFNN
ncbi:MAG: signal recognition particle protein [Pelagibacteraceae bacterium]|jgi:signal recognition particle subunit SRP54|nr:signal recognition particle protein [Pelagibacteraceae bacterium]HJL58476.1 signal recognition particle protein [Alphaproteobacteria bacterium]MBO6467961.1 signal recognition particle protein [Pelagibacteraceae bacterium]MBO6469241.1 signal recognition particle protein [Pelagibacteraceae bacterium]MBO6469760.1 signal recognition particle protein [Pelagibacteraceae bacterium]